MMKAGMRDVDDVEHAERDRHADRHGGVEAAEQNAGDHGVDQKVEAKAHLFPPGSLPHVSVARERSALRVSVQEGGRLG